MAQARRQPVFDSTSVSSSSDVIWTALRRESALFAVVGLVLYLLLALVTYSPFDPGWHHAQTPDRIANLGGRFGALVADFLMHAVGYMAYVLTLLLMVVAWRLYQRRSVTKQASLVQDRVMTSLGFILTIIGGCGLEYLHFSDLSFQQPFQPGGILGYEIGAGAATNFGTIGATVLLLIVSIIGITWFGRFSWFSLMDALGRICCERGAGLWSWLHNRLGGNLFAPVGRWKDRLGELRLARIARLQSRAEQQADVIDEMRDRLAPQLTAPEFNTPGAERESFDAHIGDDVAASEHASSIVAQPVTGQPLSDRIEPRIKPRSINKKVQQSTLFEENLLDDTMLASIKPGMLPPLTLLDTPEESLDGFSKTQLEDMSRLLERKLADYNIKVTVEEVQPGPVITRFEVEPAPGVKASQITGLARDLARALAVRSVRVVENIPGKSYVGLEIPNEDRETVRLVEGLASSAYEKMGSPLALSLGKDIAGEAVITDLTRMPHLLIAGTTGAGKSVCINALILSMLYKSSPERVRLIMVDPKMLELSVYEGIPHLLTPVVTDMQQAANALRWCIAEMERRFKIMSSLGVRNIGGYNRKVKQALEAGSPLMNPLIEEDQEPEELGELPFIVVVIDELADLMMVVGKKVEELITRIAQRARAAGIHLILATQRPSVDVITGLLKANIPCRIAFQVSSRVDSRTVLDQMGAETLLGHGDMLFLPPGTGALTRVHGSFVDDHEVHRVVEAVKKSGVPDYDPEVLEGGPDTSSSTSAGDGDDNGGETDPLYDEALRFITETRRASISAVQRKLRVGYNRAARMIEAMEAAGAVGPLESNGKRDVLAPPPPE